MTTWYLGTMGFSYTDWQGPFYPPGMPTRNFLRHYARYFNAVEIDSTFYGTPRRSALMGWAAAVDEAFRFCLKTPREVTHERRLQGPLAQEAMGTFLEAVAVLEAKLGVILLQFPPSYAVDERKNLATFLEKLPTQYRYAVEFRHQSWYQDETARLLTALGVTWASTDYPHLPAEVQLTSDVIYIRWIGQHGRFAHHREERLDVNANLLAWKRKLQAAVTADHTVFGFFNNDYAGFAAGTCNRFKALLGMPVQSLEPPRQGRLFD